MAKRRRVGKLRKFLIAFMLPLAVLLMILWLALSLYVVYQVMHPESKAPVVTPSAFLLPFEEFQWQAEDGVVLTGWFIQAKSPRTMIFLCHGYGSNRGKPLSLAEKLYAAGFSVAVLGLRGHEGSVAAKSTLGWQEAGDLLMACDKLKRDKKAAGKKLGVWGVDIGAFAALAAASQESTILAVVADSPFLSVIDYMDYHTDLFYGTLSAPLHRVASHAFSVAAGSGFWSALPTLDPGRLAKVQMLLIISEREPLRTALSEKLVSALSGRPQILRLPQTRADEMSGSAQEDYDQRITAFFQRVQW
jgi:hypothetical protein